MKQRTKIKPLRIVAVLMFFSLAIQVANAQELESQGSEGGCSDGYGKRFSSFVLTLEARARLQAYDQVAATISASKDVPAEYIRFIESVRGEVLAVAISAYYTSGPVQYADDPKVLYEELQSYGNEYAWFQNPESLEVLVECGILPHLPQSFYETGCYYSGPPPVVAPPGSVYYYPIKQRKGALLGPDSPGGIESFLLAIYHDSPARGLEEYELMYSIVGDYKLVFPTTPTALAFVGGQLLPGNELEPVEVSEE